MNNDVCVVTQNNGLNIFTTTKGDLTRQDLQLKVTGAGGNGFIVKSDLYYPLGTCSDLKNAGELANFAWLSDCNLLASSDKKLIAIEFNYVDMSCKIKQELTIPEENKSIYSVSVNANGSIAAVQLTDGSIWKYCNNHIQPWFDGPGSPCARVKIVDVDDSSYVVSLSDRHRLYKNGEEIASSITSFALHSDFLLVTTLKHTLRCLPLANLISLESATDPNQWDSEAVRSLERGSKLILACSKDSRTILQMPRGNLEVIHPRALVIAIVKNHLDNLRYKETMEILRRHRINLNLFVDHDPDKFFGNLDQFIGQVGDPQRICLFVADLLNEDVTMTMYRSLYDQSGKVTDPAKIDTVCDRLLVEMASKDEELFLLPILSCIIKNSKTDVSDALERIKKVRALNSGLADEALQFLMLLTDVNVLFDVALGLYDFDLVLFVAERSQKDPKEYLPFLNMLKKHQGYYRKYHIDLHLKRYSKALKNLSKVDKMYEQHEEEALNLIKSQRLYSDAMDIFKSDPAMHKLVCQIYGDYLMSKNYYEDAALTYEEGKFIVEAAAAWERATAWRQCLTLVKANGSIFSTMEYQDICNR